MLGVLYWVIGCIYQPDWLTGPYLAILMLSKQYKQYLGFVTKSKNMKINVNFSNFPSHQSTLTLSILVSAIEKTRSVNHGHIKNIPQKQQWAISMVLECIYTSLEWPVHSSDRNNMTMRLYKSIKSILCTIIHRHNHQIYTRFWLISHGIVQGNWMETNSLLISNQNIYCPFKRLLVFFFFFLEFWKRNFFVQTLK